MASYPPGRVRSDRRGRRSLHRVLSKSSGESKTLYLKDGIRGSLFSASCILGNRRQIVLKESLPPWGVERNVSRQRNTKPF